MRLENDIFLTQMSLVSRSLKSEAERRLMRHGVHAGQQFILACLWEQDGLTPGEIATRIRVEAPTVTRAVQRMTTAGLIRVDGDQRDGRRIKIWLTGKGDRLRNVIPGVTGGLEEEALSLLSAGERGTLIRLLDRVKEALERHEQSDDVYEVSMPDSP